VIGGKILHYQESKLPEKAKQIDELCSEAEGQHGEIERQHGEIERQHGEIECLRGEREHLLRLACIRTWWLKCLVSTFIIVTILWIVFKAKLHHKAFSMLFFWRPDNRGFTV
jgi:hypothetical protein